MLMQMAEIIQHENMRIYWSHRYRYTMHRANNDFLRFLTIELQKVRHACLMISLCICTWTGNKTITSETSVTWASMRTIWICACCIFNTIVCVYSWRRTLVDIWKNDERYEDTTRKWNVHISTFCMNTY